MKDLTPFFFAFFRSLCGQQTGFDKTKVEIRHARRKMYVAGVGHHGLIGVVHRVKAQARAVLWCGWRGCAGRACAVAAFASGVGMGFCKFLFLNGFL